MWLCFCVSSVADSTSCFHPLAPSYSPRGCVLICAHSLFLSPAVALDLLVLQFASLWNKRWPLQPHLFITLFYGLHILFGIWAVASWKGQTSQFPCQQIQSAVTLHKKHKNTTRSRCSHSRPTWDKVNEVPCQHALSVCTCSMYTWRFARLTDATCALLA